jgi:thiol:disulfide interchange protein
MKTKFCFLPALLALFAFLAPTVRADFGAQRSPFGVSVATNFNAGTPGLTVAFTVPTDCVLYAERLHFLSEDGSELTPKHIPAPVLLVDKVTGHEKKLYDRNFNVELEPVKGSLAVKFQGCTNAACFFPEKRTFAAGPDGAYAEVAATATAAVQVSADPAAPTSDWQTPAKNFQVVAQQTGYVKASEFVSFLNQAAAGNLQASNDPLAKYKRFGLAATLVLILLGGLGLNLTPCVLPLIPINLAIIGAGKAAHSRMEGFLHGAAYGLGMSLAYGILGLAVVLTGAKFGTLNSSIWFNVAIALIFLVLSLAMFDVFHIDFTRFDRLLGKRESRAAHQTRSKWLVAFTLGAIAALLAGACVAPVVISVLLMATDLHAKGLSIGLALPFLLGVGMALPWPFMGASLSFLPKPGKWMVYVKYTFGVAIILFALYYGNLAYGLFQSRHARTSLAAAPGSATAVEGGDQTLAQALQEAHAAGKPVFVDFAASWCKNCEAMDLTVFNQTNVQRRLKDFVVVRYQAERPNESPAREVLDHFNVLGLPTYLVLSAK